MQLLLDNFEENEQIEKESYYKQSLCEAFLNRDPKRFEKFINSTIDQLDLNQLDKSRSILGFVNYLQVAFKWKFLSFYTKLVSKILSQDTKDFSTAKNLADIVQPIHKLITHKHWSLIAGTFGRYISECALVTPNSDDTELNHIHDYLSEVADSLLSVDDSEAGQLLLNNCITNIISVYKKSFEMKQLEVLPQNLVNLGIRISFICIEKLAQKSTSDEATSTIQTIIKNIFATDKIKATIEYIDQFKSHENWRIREHYLFIIEGLNATLVRKLALTQLRAHKELVLPFFYDENIYVRKMARL